jgi:hypothetical protein
LPIQILGGALAIPYLVNPYIIQKVDTVYCFCKFSLYAENWTTFVLVWGVYYLGTLAYATIILSYKLIVSQNRKLLWYLWAGYMAFFPTSIGILGWDRLGYITSFMCALAISVAILSTYASLKFTDEDLRAGYPNLLKLKKSKQH